MTPVGQGADPIEGVPPPGLSLAGLSGPFELILGLLLVLGLFSRPAAFVASGFCAVGYWMVHGTQGLFPILNGGETIALYCFVFLYLTAAGPGPWSVDAFDYTVLAGGNARLDLRPAPERAPIPCGRRPERRGAECLGRAHGITRSVACPVGFGVSHGRPRCEREGRRRSVPGWRGRVPAGPGQPATPGRG